MTCECGMTSSDQKKSAHQQKRESSRLQVTDNGSAASAHGGAKQPVSVAREQNLGSRGEGGVLVTGLSCC